MMRMLRSAALLAGVLFTTSGNFARAQDLGDPRRGLDLAQDVCAQCHAIRKGDDVSPNANAPTFEEIASVPGMTGIALAVALRTSHKTMPNLVLEGDELEDVIAYILSLKTER